VALAKVFPPVTTCGRLTCCGRPPSPRRGVGREPLTMGSADPTIATRLPGARPDLVDAADPCRL